MPLEFVSGHVGLVTNVEPSDGDYLPLPTMNFDDTEEQDTEEENLRRLGLEPGDTDALPLPSMFD